MFDIEKGCNILFYLLKIYLKSMKVISACRDRLLITERGRATTWEEGDVSQVLPWKKQEVMEKGLAILNGGRGHKRVVLTWYI